MSNIKLWISAFRLKTLPLSVSGILIGTALAYYRGFFSIWIFVFSILTTLSLQILSNLANDYGDGVKGTDNENRIGPERAVQSGEITPAKMFEAIRTNILIVIACAISLIYASFGVTDFLYALVFFALTGFSVYAAMSYTVGDSPYGYRALGDLFVFIFFGFVSVVGVYFLQTKHLDHVVILPAISLGLLSVGVLNLNNMRDIESDREANKITLALKLGQKRAKQYHITLIVLAIVISILFSILYYSSPYNFMFYLAFIPLIKHIKTVHNTTSPKDFDPQLKVLALSAFLFSILLGLGQVIY
jgi:1,4-dihydroxy-2-naphthoate octaprenyltransferase